MTIEWFWDHRGQKGIYRLGDTLANLGCGIMDQTTGVFAKIITVTAFTTVHAACSEFRGAWDWPDSAWGWAGAFILSDFAYYWAHRWSHRVNLFWIGHVVHHQSEDYNLGVALRQSAAQKILMMWVYWPLAVAGLPPWMFASVMAVNLVYQFWIHTESIRHLGPLEWIMNTPSHHRVHHGRNPEYIDKNHAGVFIIWDRLFGTFQPETAPPIYGITVPAETFNPVRAQLQPWGRLWHGMQQMPDLPTKLKFLFSPPGWGPAQLGGVIPPPAMDPAAPKFQVMPAQSLLIGLLTRWALTLLGALGLLIGEASLSTTLLASGVLWVLWNLWWVGAVWDGQKISKALTGPIPDLMISILFAAHFPGKTTALLFVILALFNLQWLFILRRSKAEEVS